MTESAAGEHPAPTPPAGWYPHPTMAATRAYWDGSTWTAHVAPDDGRDAGRGGGPHRPPAADGFAWTVALVPVVVVALTGLLGDLGAGLTLGYVLAVLSGVLDRRRLLVLGPAPHVATVLLPPVYLVMRLRRTDEPSRPSEVGLVLWVLGLIVVALSG